MSGVKPYPVGFLQAIQDISGDACEKCGGNRGVQTHHIWGRGMMGKTINRLWNCIALCIECHKPGTGNYKHKINLFTIHLRNLMTYCQQWGKRPSKEWTRLEPGAIANFDELRDQMKKEGVNKEG